MNNTFAYTIKGPCVFSVWPIWAFINNAKHRHLESLLLIPMEKNDFLTSSCISPLSNDVMCKQPIESFESIQQIDWGRKSHRFIPEWTSILSGRFCWFHIWFYSGFLVLIYCINIMAIVKVINMCRYTATKIIHINQTNCELKLLNLWSVNVNSVPVRRLLFHGQS